MTTISHSLPLAHAKLLTDLKAQEKLLEYKTLNNVLPETQYAETALGSV